MTDTPPEPPQPPAVGPLAHEAALLLDVVADRLASMKRAAPGTGQWSDGGATPRDGAHSAAPNGRPQSGDARCPECGSVPGASCTVCPVCRFIAVLRGERPEATARLVDGALLIIRTLRSLMADPADAADSAAPPHPSGDRAGRRPPDPSGQPPPRRGGLEHIDIS